MSYKLPAVSCFLVLANTFALSVAEEIRFNRDVRPILTQHCLACHGADEEAREADLRLDEREVAIEIAIQPGVPEESELIRRIFSTDPDESMPPVGHTTLTDREKTVLRQWIAQGAEYESHWAFLTPSMPQIPVAQPPFDAWPHNAIDNFVLRRLTDNDLSPAAMADRYTLIRRLYLDLIGLPPTTEEVHVFVNDDSQEAYEQLVDRLLASEHFGEHWARVWLDLARYADTKGYEKDNHRTIWKYRDWVIAAYNHDMPYHRFTLEQLAGDLVTDATDDQLIATAFHRNTMTNDEGGTDNEEFRTIAVKDRVDTTVQVWMGLTMGCAKCHSHKYDPISQDEYYQFYAFFNQTEDADRSDEEPKLRSPSEDQQALIAKLTSDVAATKERKASLESDVAGFETTAAELKELEKKLAEAKRAVTTTPIMRELAAEKRRTTHVHIRGNFLELGQEVNPATPAAFGEFPPSAPLDRRGVAAWITQAQNPLAARVAVNRVWARFFGVGLVETEEDFGSQGALPSHPELLDWLALTFHDELDGSHKRLCKLIVMSSTYRQSSVNDGSAADKDPNNRLLSRSPRFRLAAETVRDQALVAAGLLTRDVGGPSVMPPQPDGIWKATYSSAKWKTAMGRDRYRRGLYTYWRRTSPYPSMLTFDAGSREVCLVRRIRTNIPLQALITLNDPVFVESAGALAKAVLDSKLSLNSQRIAYAFQRVLVRPPSEEEAHRLVALLEEARAEFTRDSGSAAALLETARVQVGDGYDQEELAAWIMLANVLLNLDETLMRN